MQFAKAILLGAHLQCGCFKVVMLLPVAPHLLLLSQSNELTGTQVNFDGILPQVVTGSLGGG